MPNQYNFISSDVINSRSSTEPVYILCDNSNTIVGTRTFVSTVHYAITPESLRKLQAISTLYDKEIMKSTHSDQAILFNLIYKGNKVIKEILNNIGASTNLSDREMDTSIEPITDGDEYNE